MHSALRAAVTEARLIWMCGGPEGMCHWCPGRNWYEGSVQAHQGTAAQVKRAVAIPCLSICKHDSFVEAAFQRLDPPQGFLS
jgi:hypothetical protein